jgi:hypothetical protein
MMRFALQRFAAHANGFRSANHPSSPRFLAGSDLEERFSVINGR